MKLRLPRSRIFRSASLKLAAVYGLLFALSSYALVFFLWWATTGLLDQQVEAAIRADGQAFDERWADGGLPTLMLAIQERLAENFEDDAIYSINAPNGKRIYGNLERWPANVVEPGVFYEVPLIRDGEKVVAIVTSYNLYGGAHLLVGRDVKGRLQFKRLLPGMLL